MNGADYGRQGISASPGRLGLQKPGVDVFVPGVELALHGGDAVGHAGGPIIAFADVVLQVVKVQSSVFEALDEFVIADPNRGSGNSALIRIVGVVPEQCIASDLPLAFEQRNQTLPVEVLIRLERHSGKIKHRRIEVRADHRGIADAVGFCDTGSTDQKRFADAAFVQPAFAALAGEDSTLESLLTWTVRHCQT